MKILGCQVHEILLVMIIVFCRFCEYVIHPVFASLTSLCIKLYQLVAKHWKYLGSFLSLSLANAYIHLQSNFICCSFNFA